MYGCGPRPNDFGLYCSPHPLPSSGRSSRSTCCAPPEWPPLVCRTNRAHRKTSCSRVHPEWKVWTTLTGHFPCSPCRRHPAICRRHRLTEASTVSPFSFHTPTSSSVTCVFEAPPIRRRAHPAASMLPEGGSLSKSACNTRDIAPASESCAPRSVRAATSWHQLGVYFFSHSAIAERIAA